MSSTPPMKSSVKPKATRLRAGVLYNLRKRKSWRKRAQAATLDFCTWPAGKPGREAIETEAIKAQDKVSLWYRPRYGDRALSAIRRRAVAAFRAQFAE